MGFLKVSNRICVALSRAKKGLYCIGNFELFAQKSKLWKNITQTLSEAKSIGQSLCLACQNHPDVFNEVKTDTDFNSCPDGGCNLKCNYWLQCGHSCVLYCHPYDRYHEYVECRKPCFKTCISGHPCQKLCFEVCHPCGTLIDRVLSLCSHTINAACGLEESEILCKNQCKKTCDIGHLCDKKCFEYCGICEVLIERTLSRCGHTVNARCGESEYEIKCKNPCDKFCIRGHQCMKKCFESCVCKILVDKTCSRCGITDKFPCDEFSKAKCKNSCIKECTAGHLFKKKCSEYYDICEVLIDRTLSRCGHTVKARCGESEYEIKCKNPCDKFCIRGHQCIKKCFESCVCEILVDKTCLKCGITNKFHCDEVSNAKCKNACIKKCASGHLCYKKCFEICYCEILVEKTLKCGHTIMAACGEVESNEKCMLRCEKILSCQHQCQKKCYEQCTRVMSCKEVIEIQSLECSHKAKIQCRLKNSSMHFIRSCTKLCQQKLECGHVCQGYCHSCRMKQSHLECRELCKKKLPCGHECTNKCNESCVVKCTQIIDIHLLVCGHSIKGECFTKNNLEAINDRCEEPCKIVLPCGHTCEGTCSACKQGTAHIMCKKSCNKALLVCTNIGNELCSQTEGN